MRADETNPYVGLRPFEIDESILFFGRNEQATELLQRLHQHHFVAVVGSSGSGKSSLLRAGLIPALKAGFLVDDSDQWFISIMKPGQSPLYNFAESLLFQLNADFQSENVNNLVQQIIEEGADVIINLLTPIRKDKNTNFFLLVDQFEELFRFAMEINDTSKKDEAIDFVNIILELAQQNTIPFYVVLTMRTDFIGDCVEFYGLPEAMNKSLYLVPRMSRQQIKSVIEGPAKLYGLSVDPALTSKLLNDLGKVKDELPLLQHALMRMWDFESKVNKSGAIDFDDYEKVGGIEKALSQHADEALSGMSEEEGLITKKLFQALTAIDENGRKIRRPVLLSELKELTAASQEQLLHIIDLFICNNRSFLIINKATDLNDKIIDISHESLIRQWNTLCDWVEEEGESTANYLQLAEATKLNKQRKKEFLDEIELKLNVDWFNKFKPTATWANRYKPGFEDCVQYLKASEDESIRLFNIERVRNRNRMYQAGAIIGLLVLVLVVVVYYSIKFNGQKAEAHKNLIKSYNAEISTLKKEIEIAQHNKISFEQFKAEDLKELEKVKIDSLEKIVKDLNQEIKSLRE